MPEIGQLLGGMVLFQQSKHCLLDWEAVSRMRGRYAVLKPTVNAIRLRYRGPLELESGEMPVGGITKLRLIEADGHQEANEMSRRGA